MELCSIASGSSGNCICAGSDACHILIDAGISGRRIEKGLNSLGLKTGEIQAILITHEHIDHIAGLGVLSRHYGIPLYATEGTIEAVKKTKSVGVIEEGLFHIVKPQEAFTIGDLTIEPIAVSHDAAAPAAYKVMHQQKAAAVMTDLGKYDETIVEKLKKLDVLLLEANHDIRMLEAGSYPYVLKKRILGEKGHLSNESSGRLLSEVLHDDFKAVVLGHLSKENNYPELAYETVRMEVTLGDNPYKADDFPIYVADRENVSARIQF